MSWSIHSKTDSKAKSFIGLRVELQFFTRRKHGRRCMSKFNEERGEVEAEQGNAAKSSVEDKPPVLSIYNILSEMFAEIMSKPQKPTQSKIQSGKDRENSVCSM